jgi:hypothetical protein
MLAADQSDPVAAPRFGHVGDVDRDQVHRDVADEGARPATAMPEAVAAPGADRSISRRADSRRHSPPRSWRCGAWFQRKPAAVIADCCDPPRPSAAARCGASGGDDRLMGLCRPESGCRHRARSRGVRDRSDRVLQEDAEPNWRARPECRGAAPAHSERRSICCAVERIVALLGADEMAHQQRPLEILQARRSASASGPAATVRPSRFMPVSTWIAALPFPPIEAAEAGPFLDLLEGADDGAQAEPPHAVGQVPGKRPFST